MTKKELVELIDMAIQEAEEMDVTWRGHSVAALLKEVKAKGFPSNKDPAPSNYKQYIALYIEFFQELTGGTKPAINAASGKSLKRIAKHLQQASKTGDEQGALQGWHYILANWKKLSPFLQQQTGILQIEKNLNEIFTQLRNGHHDKAAKRHADRQAVQQASDDLSEFIRQRSQQ